MSEFNQILFETITLDTIEYKIEGADIHRKILINKRLKMAKKALKKTYSQLGNRFDQLFLSYAEMNFPRPTKNLFQDSIDFYLWVKSLMNSELYKNFDLAEINRLLSLSEEKTVRLYYFRDYHYNKNVIQIFFKFGVLRKEIIFFSFDFD